MQEIQLSEENYDRLKQEVAQELRIEIRRVRRQNLFAVGLQAIVLVIIAVLLFKASRQYHDLTLWAAGVCLLIFSSLDFLDLEYISTGRSWMDLFSKDKNN